LIIAPDVDIRSAQKSDDMSICHWKKLSEAVKVAPQAKGRRLCNCYFVGPHLKATLTQDTNCDTTQYMLCSVEVMNSDDMSSDKEDICTKGMRR
jgi:hypothetical protein